MKYLLLQEQTDWEFPNHIYITNESKSRLFGYFPIGSIEPVMFEKRMSFDTKYRKFKQIAKV